MTLLEVQAWVKVKDLILELSARPNPFTDIL